MKRIRYKSFMSLRSDDHPDLTRRRANNYANKVWSNNDENRIINITEAIKTWGTVVTVWYEADKEITND